MRILLAVLMTCLSLAAPAQAETQKTMTAMDIVKHMDQALSPTRPSIRKIVLTMSTKDESVQWTARQALQQFPEGKRMLLVVQEPTEMRGSAYLIEQPTDKPSAEWVYMPALRRVRELVNIDAYEHFFGTDFTYADLDFVRLHPNYRLLAEEEHAGIQTYKIEETVPEERAYYSQIMSWVAQDSFLPVQRDYYDVAGKLWKTERWTVSPIDGVPTPVRIEMTDLQAKSTTTLEASQVDYDASIPESLFDPTELPGAAEAAVWQTTAASAATSQ